MVLVITAAASAVTGIYVTIKQWSFMHKLFYLN